MYCVDSRGLYLESCEVELVYFGAMVADLVLQSADVELSPVGDNYAYELLIKILYGSP